MKRTYFLFLVFSVVSISVVVAGCSLVPQASLGILYCSLEKETVEEKLTSRIVGAARNDGVSRIDYAEIKGSFYDENETLLATGFAKTIYQEGEQKGESFTLDPGQIWEFTIFCPESTLDPYPSLGILECKFVSDYSTEAKLVGRAQNDGNVTLAFAKLTGHFYDRLGTDIDTGTGTSSTTDLPVGEIWEFTIYFSSSDVGKPEGGYVRVEAPADLQAAEVPSVAEQADYVSVQVGTLRGSTIMP